MRKTRILIASVLKPVNDTRMFEKMGQSLAKLPGTGIHICGFAAQNMSNVPNISFHPLFNFPRLSFGRVFAQWKYYRLLLQLKPDIIIPNTYELLPVICFYRIFNRTVILYDIRENYLANILHQPTFPKGIRRLLASTVRLIELLAKPFITHFILAEKTYARELTFLGKNYTILENKYQGPPASEKTFPVELKDQALHLLYSGTISETYGIFEAIQLADNLHQLDTHTRLTIIGYSPLSATFEKLRTLIAAKPYISLIGGNNLIPHDQIVSAIKQANVGILPYQPNLSTANCIPTKLFEYLANGLPVIIPFNIVWEQIVRRHSAGFAIDFSNQAPEQTLNRLRSDAFYAGGIPDDVFWKKEEEKLLSFFSRNIIKN